MKVALIGDIHANLPALEVVLAHAHQQEVEAIWNVGDWLGYGAFPNEVVVLLRQENHLSIIGNYDLKILHVGQEAEKKGRKSERQLSFRWTYENLAKENRKYLRTLSQEIRLEMEGRRILLTHGSPASNAEGINPEMPPERLHELAQMADADVVVCGHSHQPLAKEVEGVWFINTGSVGRPDDGDPRACYAVLEIGPGSFAVQHHRVEYDLQRAIAAIRKHNLPEVFAQMVLQGRSLEGVKEAAAGAAGGTAAGGAAVADAVPPEPAGPGSEEAAALTAGSSAEETAPRSPSGPPAAPPSSEDEEALAAVRQLARSYPDEDGHAGQVTRLALRLFDELQPLHKLGEQARFWLQCAGLLHDIGWVQGGKGHHKTSLQMILDSSLLPFDWRERLIVGSIARYHRRALPSKAHAHYAELRARDRRAVSLLAALLRVADGLDCTHQRVVEDISVVTTAKKIVLHCTAPRPAEEERLDALHKGDLLEQLTGRGLVIEWTLS